MSAFYTSKRTIDNVVQTMRPALMSGDEAANAFGRELREMNAEALRQRYKLDGTQELRDMLGDAREYVYEEHKDTSDVQLLKSLCCFTYQCSEGDIGDAGSPFTPLFRKCIAHEQMLGAELRKQFKKGEDQQIPGYDAAEWDQNKLCRP